MKKLFLAFLTLTLTACGLIQYSVQDVVEIGYDSTLYVQTAGGHCSAFAIDYDLVVTAAHCVETPNIFMKFGSNTVLGEVLVDDNESDVAVIHTTARIPGIVPLLYNISPIRAGERLVGIGFPFYTGDEVTFNIGYFIGYADKELVASEVCFRGSSGGAVLDELGRVVGICSRIAPMIDFYGEGLHHSHKELNILVPISKVKDLLDGKK
jgi:S1-C subfamily serine protease